MLTLGGGFPVLPPGLLPRLIEYAFFSSASNFASILQNENEIFEEKKSRNATKRIILIKNDIRYKQKRLLYYFANAKRGCVKERVDAISKI